VDQPVSHLKDDDLVLHYYGEAGPEMVTTARHLEGCAECARAYEALARTLGAVKPPEFVEVPDDTQAIRQLLRREVRTHSWLTEPRALGRAVAKEAQSGVQRSATHGKANPGLEHGRGVGEHWLGRLQPQTSSVPRSIRYSATSKNA